MRTHPLHRTASPSAGVRGDAAIADRSEMGPTGSSGWTSSGRRGSSWTPHGSRGRRGRAASSRQPAKPLSSEPDSRAEPVFMIKPLSLLNQSINSNVLVELKSGRGYRGILDGFDPHMNGGLKNAEELLNGEPQRKMDLAIVRGDNVIYISP